MIKSFYSHRVFFKGILFIFGLGLIFALFFYIEQTVDNLRKESRGILNIIANLHAKVVQSDIEELNVLFTEFIQKTNFPIIITDSDGNPTYWKGIPVNERDKSSSALERVNKIVDVMDITAEPIPVTYQEIVLNYIHYGDSETIRSLGKLPYIQILGVGLFILIGFVGFNQIRRSEQQFIWVGMAKETAHQLGTPISSLMGWLELLKSDGNKKDRIEATIKEMERDVIRLQKVAQRFSQIGSGAELIQIRVTEILEDVVGYFQQRLPQLGKAVVINEEYNTYSTVAVNRGLFEWAVENLIKNSLDAIESVSGKITVRTQMAENQKDVYIDIIDTGRGIEKKFWNEIFKPGFSTKRRGWGLGLSLTKRIIEDYHKGSLFVYESKIGSGATMRLRLKGTEKSV